MYPRNAATPPRIGIGPVVQISDGVVQTSGVSVAVRPEGGAEAAGAGAVSYGGTTNSVFYAPTQAETNYTAFVVTAYKAGCIPVSVTVVTSASATAGRVVPETAPPTAAAIADAVWDEPGADHVTPNTFGAWAQLNNATITTATASTVTLPSPWNTGTAVGRSIYANGQFRWLESHAGSGVYNLNANWTAPADNSPATVGGGVVTPAVIWAASNRSLTDKAGFALSAAGLDAISVADFAGAANTLPKLIVRLWRRFFGPASKTSTQLRTFADDGTTVRTTQAVSDDGTTETQGLAS